LACIPLPESSFLRGDSPFVIPTVYANELQVALVAAEQAGRDVLARYATFIQIPDAPANISTEADRQAQEIILQYLQASFPQDALSAEEATPTLAAAAQSGERLWIVDPIDGTRGFARKNGEFSLMVALVERGHMAVGVVLQPARQRLTFAARGGGCWRRDGTDAEAVRCQVSSVTTLPDATLTQSRPRSAETPTWPVRALRPRHVIETYSAGIKLALVARGEADLYVNTYDAFHDWDICAGHLLVEEAGGRVTGLAGQELVYGRPGALQANGLLASNGRLHETALAKLQIDLPPL
jgi:3'(2'), 5'-bisphosphate nucleotidase